MGVICPCGVLVQNPQDPSGEAVSTSNNVQFEGQGGTITGDLFYKADICVTRLATSTLTLRFEDTETPGENDFTFTATSFTRVECDSQGQNCEIEVEGFGTISGRTGTFRFEATFRDIVDPAANDNVQDFEIDGFFDQNGAAPITQGSIESQGCQEL